MAGYMQFQAAWADMCADTFNELRFQNQALLGLLADVGHEDKVKELEASFEDHSKMHRKALEGLVEASLKAKVKKDGKVLNQHDIYRLWQDLIDKQDLEAESAIIDEEGVGEPEEEPDP
jgi:hypothetical protein